MNPQARNSVTAHLLPPPGWNINLPEWVAMLDQDCRTRTDWVEHLASVYGAEAVSISVERLAVRLAEMEEAYETANSNLQHAGVRAVTAEDRLDRTKAVLLEYQNLERRRRTLAAEMAECSGCADRGAGCERHRAIELELDHESERLRLAHEPK